MLNIRRIQYAPFSPIENPPSRIIEHNFMACTGNIELEASLDKSVKFCDCSLHFRLTYSKLERWFLLLFFRIISDF